MGNAKSEFENSFQQSAKSLTPFQLSFSILIKKLSRIQMQTQQYSTIDSNAEETDPDNRFKGKCYKHEKIALLKLLDMAEKMMVDCKEMEGGLSVDWYPYEKAIYAMRKKVMMLQEKEDLTDLNVLPDPPEFFELGLND